jgi:hypothetical protein
MALNGVFMVRRKELQIIRSGELRYMCLYATPMLSDDLKFHYIRMCTYDV